MVFSGKNQMIILERNDLRALLPSPVICGIFAHQHTTIIMGLFSILFSGKYKQLKAHIANGATLLDVRTKGEFNTGSAKGAINIPLDQLEKNIGKLKGSGQVVVFCRTGARSAMAKRILMQHDIPVFNGGSWGSVESARKAT
jgi:phage shock protein E